MIKMILHLQILFRYLFNLKNKWGGGDYSGRRLHTRAFNLRTDLTVRWSWQHSGGGGVSAQITGER